MMLLRKVEEIENFSGGVKLSTIHGKIRPLRKGYFRVLNITVSGDAPKDFLQAYKYGEGRKDKPGTWPKYIAKVGHKWYPIESITEYLLNRIGLELGLEMAESELRLVDNQIRFLSKYFLRPNEELVHGAQIFSAYLEEHDNTFVEDIEKRGMARELFTFQFATEAIKFVFPKQASRIVTDFVRLLLFDAITGNNDRHFYNWGVIRDISKRQPPRFSPIYDSARGLFWNYPEEKLLRMLTNEHKIEAVQFEKYVQNSRPKTGWEGLNDLNHFDLIEAIVNHFSEYALICKELLHDVHLGNIINELQSNFKHFFSFNRFILIEACLTERFKRLQKICFKS